MTATLDTGYVVASMLHKLDETFVRGGTHYLDPNTSLFETLAGIPAEVASVPVSSRCNTLSAQVEHIRLTLDVSNKVMLGIDYGTIDWGEIWRTVGAVTPEEWADSQQRLRASYDAVRSTMANPASWGGNDNISEALVILIHSAYHLGEVRQALCTLMPLS
jgi:hypothetical protein